MKKLLASLFILGCTMATAQQSSTIDGEVESTTGTALPGVTVSVESDQLEAARYTVSGENGQFLLRHLPAGVYTLTAAMAGMKTVRESVTLGLDRTARPTIYMQPASNGERKIIPHKVRK